MFDKDGDGKITIRELGELFRSLSQAPTDAEREEISELTEELVETIDFGDFLYLMAKKISHTDMEQELINAFKIFDGDGNGRISTPELKHIISNIGGNITDEEIDVMIKEAEPDKDGQIDYHQFIRMMMAK